MRRANGTGSIYKTSGNRRKPWRAVISRGRNAAGNHTRLTIGYYSTRPEAESAIKKFLDAPVEKPNITLGELRAEWMARKYQEISKQTQDNYNAAWNALKELEGRKMKDIRSGQLQAALDQAAGGESTKKKIRTLAVQLWRYALENDIVEKNYAQFLRVVAEQKEERKIITAIQRKKLEQAATAGDEFAGTVLILCYTGFRLNEFLGLTPFSLVRDEAGNPIAFQGGLKTAAGKNRIVPIHNKIKPYVFHWLGKGGQYIFCKEGGKRMADTQYRELFKKKMAEIGAEGLNPHATRHTFFSMADEAKISPAKIMSIGGHADPTMTKHYTHSEILELIEAVNSLG